MAYFRQTVPCNKRIRILLPSYDKVPTILFHLQIHTLSQNRIRTILPVILSHLQNIKTFLAESPISLKFWNILNIIYLSYYYNHFERKIPCLQCGLMVGLSPCTRATRVQIPGVFKYFSFFLLF